MGGFFESTGHFEVREPSSLSPMVLNMTNETRPYKRISCRVPYVINHLDGLLEFPFFFIPELA
jgi:hypothetical protein